MILNEVIEMEDTKKNEERGATPEFAEQPTKRSQAEIGKIAEWVHRLNRDTLFLLQKETIPDSDLNWLVNNEIDYRGKNMYAVWRSQAFGK